MLQIEALATLGAVFRTDLDVISLNIWYTLSTHIGHVLVVHPAAWNVSFDAEDESESLGRVGYVLVAATLNHVVGAFISTVFAAEIKVIRFTSVTVRNEGNFGHVEETRSIVSIVDGA